MGCCSCSSRNLFRFISLNVIVLNTSEQPGHVVTQGKVVALFAGLLVVHGILVCSLHLSNCMISIYKLCQEFTGNEAVGMDDQRVRFHQRRRHHP